LRSQCAISTAVMSVTRTITVAAGAFAPGHLGELTRIVPFEMADAVLEEVPGARERRVRLLPSRAGLYFLLAMCLFPRAGYLGVWGKLTAALDGLGLAVPSPKALRDLRRRIGIAPVRRLFEILAGPQGQPRTPGIMFRGYRTVSFDGCKSIKVPDTAKNRAWLGKQNASNGETGYPALALMTLVETGTRALLSGMPEDDARQASAEQPVAVGPVMILSHPTRIERRCDKNKLAILVQPANLREGSCDSHASVPGEPAAARRADRRRTILALPGPAPVGRVLLTSGCG